MTRGRWRGVAGLCGCALVLASAAPLPAQQAVSQQPARQPPVNQQASAPKDYLARMAPMRTLGAYAVMLPSDYATSGRSYPLCIILHGNGSTELIHGVLADWLGREDVIYAAVRAPYPNLVAIAGTRSAGYSAWPPDRVPAGSAQEEQLRANYVDWILQVADAVTAEFRVRPGRIFLIGHSQGAQFAHVTALLHPDRVESVLAFSGAMIPSSILTAPRLEALRQARTTVWLVHGKADTTSPISSSEATFAALDKAKIPVQFHATGSGHAVDLEMVAIGRQWMSEVVLKR